MSFTRNSSPIPPWSFNNYNFAFNAVQNNLAFYVSSGIRDLTAKFDMDYPASQHKLRWGGQYTYHTF